METLTLHETSHGAINKNDEIDSEFQYISSLLRVVAPSLTKQSDRKSVHPWLKKLYSPEYSTKRFRAKRNKYLLYLALSILNDEVKGIFIKSPPVGALPELETLVPCEYKAANWMRETMWKDTLAEDHTPPQCIVHDGQQCPTTPESLDVGETLDNQFLLFVHIARPYASLLQHAPERTRAATWLRHLCSVGPKACVIVKGVRNDYMMSLMGYLHGQQLAGPFMEYPPFGYMVALADAAKYAREANNINDPFSAEANLFLDSVPQVPECGAFAYVAIAGQLIDKIVRK